VRNIPIVLTRNRAYLGHGALGRTLICYVVADVPVGIVPCMHETRLEDNIMVLLTSLGLVNVVTGH
jgi:hypothetical protein